MCTNCSFKIGTRIEEFKMMEFSGVLADPKVVFAIVLRGAANGILLAHNHPSGSLKPGQDDLRITESLKRSAWLLGLKIVDHLIISPEGYYSFSAHQLL
ncbi:DNA repair protein RadC [Pedobacter steynii]|uniref:DNA repair protein RadC n=2 Tax=Pedobacter steynii TaxID=430522 RepID=A0A1G9IQG4_9SPHI|nr:DNA repair protein RadC [Pedobacter steynii]